MVFCDDDDDDDDDIRPGPGIPSMAPSIIKMVMMMFTTLQMVMMMMIPALALVFHGTPTPSVNVTRGMPGWSTHLDHH